MLYVTRRVSFSAAHRLFNPTWDDKKNEEVFDKCNNPNGHGHNYILEVTVSGKPNPDTGYVFDLKVMKTILKKYILNYVDHKHINHDVDFMKGIIPTAENMIIVFWNILEDKFGSSKLYKIKIWETENNMIEYYGEDVEVKKYDL